jgi:hypothetical protein
MTTMRTLAISLFTAALMCSCLSHKVNVDPIEVKPIHVTVDVNVKVQRELDKFFEDDAPTTPTTPTTGTTDKKEGS